MFMEWITLPRSALRSGAARPADSYSMMARFFAKLMRRSRRRPKRGSISLLALSDHLLRDIGLNRTDAAWQSRKHHCGEFHD